MSCRRTISNLGEEFSRRHESRNPFTTAHLDQLLEIAKYKNLLTAFIAALEGGYTLGYRAAEQEMKKRLQGATGKIERIDLESIDPTRSV